MRELLPNPTYAQFRDNFASYTLGSVVGKRRKTPVIDQDDRIAYLASQAVYGNSGSHDALLGQGYALDDELSSDNTRVYGRGDQAVVAYRGTSYGQHQDYLDDVSILYGANDMNPSFKNATVAAERARARYANLLLTGHSLGGTKAVTAGKALGAKTVVFNPGTSASRPLDTTGARVHRTDRDYISYNTFGGTVNTYSGGHALDSFNAVMTL